VLTIAAAGARLVAVKNLKKFEKTIDTPAQVCYNSALRACGRLVDKLGISWLRPRRLHFCTSLSHFGAERHLSLYHFRTLAPKAPTPTFVPFSK